ncbi:MAG: class I SAM-dependent methyltransferase [Acidobacteria bacterium]|nr:class I SAM-dependent methyltransferase [Acidobacteriota bacterium]MCB9398606.1 class I SAM-dependent methyltransferase [Acidobacteriota bacterium]
MKLKYGVLTASIAWMVFLLWYMNRPPKPGPDFDVDPQYLIPPRQTYDPGLAAAFEQGQRDFWQKPDQVLDVLGDLDGLTVADIGCGEGYFTLRLLDRVGPEGTVFATDIQPDLLDRLAHSVPPEWASRLQLVLAEGDTIGIEGQVDLIFLVQVLGEVSHQRAFLSALSAIMGPTSRLVLIDSKHVTDPKTGYTRPLDQNRLLADLGSMGLVPDPQIPEENLQFLPKQFFFVLVKSKPR